MLPCTCSMYMYCDYNANTLMQRIVRDSMYLFSILVRHDSRAAVEVGPVIPMELSLDIHSLAWRKLLSLLSFKTALASRVSINVQVTPHVHYDATYFLGVVIILIDFDLSQNISGKASCSWFPSGSIRILPKFGVPHVRPTPIRPQGLLGDINLDAIKEAKHTADICRLS